MASTLTGTVASLTVSGTTITGASGTLGEANVTLGKQRAKFDPVGTNVSMHATGMKTAEGTINRRWTTNDLFQNLVDNDNEFDIAITVTGGGSITISDCKAGDRNMRIAPGTEVLMESITFQGINWS